MTATGTTGAAAAPHGTGMPGGNAGSTLRRWWKAARPRTLGAAVAPVLVGTAAVLPQSFHPDRFLLALVGSVAIQAGTNMLNEHFDHVQGLDLTRQRRADMVLQTGEIRSGALLRGGVAAMLLGALCGLVLTAMTDAVLLVVGTLSILAGYAYTARPIALGYRALGEVTVFIFMGPVIVGGAAFVQTETLSRAALLLSVPVGLLVTAILHVNNVRDMADDRANGKRTLANIFGRRVANTEYIVLTLGSFALLLLYVAVGAVRWPSLLALATLPLALRAARTIRTGNGVGVLDRLLVSTAKLHLRFSALLAVGLLIEFAAHRF